jgi:hypothetical protein
MTISKIPSPFKSTVLGEDWEPITGKSLLHISSLFFLDWQPIADNNTTPMTKGDVFKRLFRMVLVMVFIKGIINMLLNIRRFGE